ncbi:uncharacterized protein [Capricornis sumatraensis]|uniref:uncharacterized protein n=1 Tax=Capricornis sumatraensis TaxID=34865 RepID=UPI0036044B4A
MARAAAGRPAASAPGQERSPRPPSGCGGQSSGDAARPGADLSQLACAAQLSNIHLRGSSRVAPFQEPGKKKKEIPSGGLSRSTRKASWGAAGRGVRDWPADPPLCSDQSFPRGPVAPRGKGGSGGLLTRGNPRHGRLRLRGARDGARTGVHGRVTEPRREYTPERPDRRSPWVGGGWDFGFYPLLRGGGEGSEVWGSPPGRRRGVVPRLPRRSRHFLDPARRASGGTASLGTPVLAVSLSRQRSLPVLRPSCSAAETPATND